MTLLDISKLKKSAPATTPAATQAAPVQSQSPPTAQTVPAPAQATSNQAVPAPAVASAPLATPANTPQTTVAAVSDLDKVHILITQTANSISTDKAKAAELYDQLKQEYTKLSHEDKEKVYKECMDLFNKIDPVI